MLFFYIENKSSDIFPPSLLFTSSDHLPLLSLRNTSSSLIKLSLNCTSNNHCCICDEPSHLFVSSCFLSSKIPFSSSGHIKLDNIRISDAQTLVLSNNQNSELILKNTKISNILLPINSGTFISTGRSKEQKIIDTEFYNVTLTEPPTNTVHTPFTFVDECIMNGISIKNSEETFYGVLCSGLTDKTALSFISSNSSFSECVRPYYFPFSSSPPNTDCLPDCINKHFRSLRFSLPSDSTSFSFCSWEDCLGEPGGAIYSSSAGASITVNSCIFNKCNSTKPNTSSSHSYNGGAIFVSGITELIVFSSTFFHCCAPQNNHDNGGSGGIFAYDIKTTIWISSSHFISCFTGSSGGGAYLSSIKASDVGPQSITSCSYIQCTGYGITPDGGGLSLSYSDYTLGTSSCLFCSCATVGCFDGGLYFTFNANSDPYPICFCFFNGNSASQGADVYLMNHSGSNPILHSFTTTDAQYTVYPSHWDAAQKQDDWLPLITVSLSPSMSTSNHANDCISAYPHTYHSNTDYTEEAHHKYVDSIGDEGVRIRMGNDGSEKDNEGRSNSVRWRSLESAFIAGLDYSRENAKPTDDRYAFVSAVKFEDGEFTSYSGLILPEGERENNAGSYLYGSGNWIMSERQPYSSSSTDDTNHGASTTIFCLSGNIAEEPDIPTEWKSTWQVCAPDSNPMYLFTLGNSELLVSGLKVKIAASSCVLLKMEGSEKRGLACLSKLKIVTSSSNTPTLSNSIIQSEQGILLIMGCEFEDISTDVSLIQITAPIFVSTSESKFSGITRTSGNGAVLNIELSNDKSTEDSGDETSSSYMPVDISKTVFSECVVTSGNGGAIAARLSGRVRLTISAKEDTQVIFEKCKAESGYGGAIYIECKDLTNSNEERIEFPDEGLKFSGLVFSTTQGGKCKAKDDIGNNIYVKCDNPEKLMFNKDAPIEGKNFAYFLKNVWNGLECDQYNPNDEVHNRPIAAINKDLYYLNGYDIYTYQAAWPSFAYYLATGVSDNSECSTLQPCLTMSAIFAIETVKARIIYLKEGNSYSLGNIKAYVNEDLTILGQSRETGPSSLSDTFLIVSDPTNPGTGFGGLMVNVESLTFPLSSGGVLLHSETTGTVRLNTIKVIVYGSSVISTIQSLINVTSGTLQLISVTIGDASHTMTFTSCSAIAIGAGASFECVGSTFQKITLTDKQDGTKSAVISATTTTGTYFYISNTEKGATQSYADNTFSDITTDTTGPIYIDVREVDDNAVTINYVGFTNCYYQKRSSSGPSTPTLRNMYLEYAQPDAGDLSQLYHFDIDNGIKSNSAVAIGDCITTLEHATTEFTSTNPSDIYISYIGQDTYFLDGTIKYVCGYEDFPCETLATSIPISNSAEPTVTAHIAYSPSRYPISQLSFDTSTISGDITTLKVVGEKNGGAGSYLSTVTLNELCYTINKIGVTFEICTLSFVVDNGHAQFAQVMHGRLKLTSVTVVDKSAHLLISPLISVGSTGHIEIMSCTFEGITSNAKGSVITTDTLGSSPTFKIIGTDSNADGQYETYTQFINCKGAANGGTDNGNHGGAIYLDVSFVTTWGNVILSGITFTGCTSGIFSQNMFILANTKLREILEKKDIWTINEEHQTTCIVKDNSFETNLKELWNPHRTNIYISSSGTDSSICGFIIAPCKTIQQGLSIGASSFILIDTNDYTGLHLHSFITSDTKICGQSTRSAAFVDPSTLSLGRALFSISKTSSDASIENLSLTFATGPFLISYSSGTVQLASIDIHTSSSSVTFISSFMNIYSGSLHLSSVTVGDNSNTINLAQHAFLELFSYTSFLCDSCTFTDINSSSAAAVITAELSGTPTFKITGDTETTYFTNCVGGIDGGAIVLNMTDIVSRQSLQNVLFSNVQFTQCKSSTIEQNLFILVSDLLVFAHLTAWDVSDSVLSFSKVYDVSAARTFTLLKLWKSPDNRFYISDEGYSLRECGWPEIPCKTLTSALSNAKSDLKEFYILQAITLSKSDNLIFRDTSETHSITYYIKGNSSNTPMHLPEDTGFTILLPQLLFPFSFKTVLQEQRVSGL